MDEKIKSDLKSILSSHYDELFRGELSFPRFNVLSYERVDEKSYRVRLELLLLDCNNDSAPYLFKNEPSIFKPVVPLELVHLINDEIITWETKEDADALSPEPYLIELESEEVEEAFKWDDPRITDSEIYYSLSAAGIDKDAISADDDLNKVIRDFLETDNKDLSSIKTRLKPFLID